MIQLVELYEDAMRSSLKNTNGTPFSELALGQVNSPHVDISSASGDT